MRLTPCFSLLFPIALGVIAILYAAVGQAGGIGYVPLMGLADFAPAIIKPTALSLNLLVSAIGCVRFYRLGLLTWRTAYPFAVLGLPFSLLGGALHLPPTAYQPVVGALLVIAGLQYGAHRPGDQGAGRRRAVGPAVYQVALPRRDY